ncbi:MAG: NnrS family protein [Rhodocyclaceae bacterium]
MAFLFGAPHRPMFLGGIVFLLAAALAWAGELAARLAGASLLPPGVPTGWLHASMMVFGVFPFFIFGFAMTAMPRWQGLPEIGPALFRSVFVLMAAGVLGSLAAAWRPALAGPALGAMVVGWTLGAIRLTRIALHPMPGSIHLIFVAVALWAGLAGVGLLLAAFLFGRIDLLGDAIEIGLWWFLVPLMASVSHRVIPFFTASELPGYVAHRPMRVLHVILIAAILHGALDLAGLRDWTGLADLPAAAAALHLSWRWNLREGLRAGLAATHHLAFVWLGIAEGLFAVQGGFAAAGVHVLGLAPLHALTIGFFGTLVLGMATRVTLGHSGLPVKADGALRAQVWLLQAVALARMAAELVPAPAAPPLVFAAACGWLAVFGAWAWRFAPLYCRVASRGGLH